jgi:pimeloyl-ACP methyl ester carboxylesterase
MISQDDRPPSVTEPRATLAAGAAGRAGVVESGIRRRSLDLDGATIAWLEAGSGAPLVLLHGIGSCADSWRPIVPLLADRYRVIAWDMPGYGASTPLGDPRPTAKPYGVLLEKWLQALKLAPAHVVGHSLGALAGAELAAARPDLVRSLVLVSPAVGSASPVGLPLPAAIQQRITELSAVGAAAFAKKRAPNLCADAPAPDAVQAVEQAMAQVRLQGYGQACWLLAQGDLAAAVQKTRAPGLVIGASGDKVVPAARAQHLAAQWPGAQYREIAGVGHAGYVEDPQAYVAPIRAFIEEN